MSSQDYVPPALDEHAFHCPHCAAYAKQDWSPLCYFFGPQPRAIIGWKLAFCQKCSEPSMWSGSQMIYPHGGAAPLPNQDLPEELKADFEEARSIVTTSPRGASALLRLVIQKLCAHVGERGKNIDDDIASLVRKGELSTRAQQALDSVRVIGNDAVHPGTIDLRDNPAMASSLFSLVNFIADKLISEPKHIEEIYGALPEAKRAAIAKRDRQPR